MLAIITQRLIPCSALGRSRNEGTLLELGDVMFSQLQSTRLEAIVVCLNVACLHGIRTDELKILIQDNRGSEFPKNPPHVRNHEN